MATLPRIIWHLDDPVADPALVPLYFVAKKAAEHVTVVLSGEGADEFFGGYTIYREPLSLAAVAALPDPLQKGLRAVSKAIPRGVKGKSFLERGTTRIEERYYGNARMFTEEEKERLMRRYDPAVRYTDVTAPVYAEAEALDDVTKMQYVDLYTWLRGDILVKADRMSMAHSLELRDEHRRKHADNSRKIWTVLVFCIWHAIFVEGSLDPGITRAESALLTKPVVGSVVA